MKWTTVAAIALFTFACSKQEVQQRAENTKENVSRTVSEAVDDVAAPFSREKPDPKQIEKERFDERWRELQSFREQQAKAKAAAQKRANVDVKFVAGAKETFKDWMRTRSTTRRSPSRFRATSPDLRC
jgi:hypothetical protein